MLLQGTTWQGIIEGTNKGIFVAELEISENRVHGRATVTEVTGIAYSFILDGKCVGNIVDATLAHFSPALEGLPKSGAMQGHLLNGMQEVTGTWTTDVQTKGNFHIYRVPTVPAPSQPLSTPLLPQSAVSKTIPLATCRLDVQGLGGLIQIILAGTKVQMPTFSIVHAGRTLIKLGVQALVDDKALPPIINEMTITANEGWESRGYTIVNVNLKRHEPNSVFVSGLDGAWVAGKCEEIKAYIASYETPFATWYRNRGAWLNSIVFLVMLSALPAIGGFWNRLAFAAIVTAMLLLLLWSHQRAIPSCTIILKTQPSSFWEDTNVTGSASRPVIGQMSFGLHLGCVSKN